MEPMSNALQSVAETLGGLMDCLPQMFCRFWFDKNGVFLDAVSAAVVELTGRKPEAFTVERLNWLELIHPSDRGILSEAIAQRPVGGFVVEYRLCAVGGSIRYVRHTGRPIDDDGTFWAGCVEDMTAIRQAQQELERSQQLQNLGRLAAGIAHEINTPIQFIGDNLHFLAEAWEAMAAQLRRLAAETGGAAMASADLEFMLTEAPDAIRQSLEGVERIGGLVAAMRDFSHLDERRMAPADLNRIVRSTLTLLRNELKYAADVHFQADAALPEVYCAGDDISRVLLNLLINAGHSIKEKIEKGLYQRGTITVSARRLQDYVEIAVADNGMGIPAEIRHRIFERFFTTKRNSPMQGTGQGLSMVQAIVEQRHNGRIWFETEEGQGTTFIVRLPIRQKTQENGG